MLDHVRDFRHVDAAGGDVGRHQHRRLAGFELGQGALALGLALVAMDGVGGNAVIGQRLHDLVGAMLGAREDQHAANALAPQDAGQDAALGGAVEDNHALVHALGGAGHGGDLHAHGVDQHVGGQARDIGRHGRAEEHRLALLGHLPDDLADSGQKTLVQHLVGFVQHQDLGVVQAGVLGVHVVHQAARRGHQNVHTAGQGALLRHMADAAKHGGDREAHVAAVALEAFRDLAGQFPRRAEHEHAAAAARRVAARKGKLMQDGQGEGGGLAGAGLRDAQDVAAEHGGRDALCLDRCGGDVSGLFECAQEERVESEFCKGGGHDKSICAAPFDGPRGSGVDTPRGWVDPGERIGRSGSSAALGCRGQTEARRRSRGRTLASMRARLMGQGMMHRNTKRKNKTRRAWGARNRGALPCTPPRAPSLPDWGLWKPLWRFGRGHG